MLKSRTGGKIMGSGWKGRAWRAVTRVARRIGGIDDPGEKIYWLCTCIMKGGENILPQSCA